MPLSASTRCLCRRLRSPTPVWRCWPEGERTLESDIESNMSFYLGSNKGPWRRAMQTIRVRAPPPLKKFTCIKVQSWPGAPGSPFTLSIGSLFSYQAPYQDNHGRFVESGESTGDGYGNCRHKRRQRVRGTTAQHASGRADTEEYSVRI